MIIAHLTISTIVYLSGSFKMWAPEYFNALIRSHLTTTSQSLDSPVFLHSSQVFLFIEQTRWETADDASGPTASRCGKRAKVDAPPRQQHRGSATTEEIEIGTLAEAIIEIATMTEIADIAAGHRAEEEILDEIRDEAQEILAGKTEEADGEMMIGIGEAIRMLENLQKVCVRMISARFASESRLTIFKSLCGMREVHEIRATDHGRDRGIVDAAVVHEESLGPRPEENPRKTDQCLESWKMIVPELGQLHPQ